MEWFIVVFIALALIPFWRRVWDKSRAEWLRRKGIKTSATVSKLQETGDQYRDGPVVVLHVTYTTPTLGKINSSVRGMITYVQLQTIKPGAIVDIVYDQNNPHRFALLEVND
jgi:hypothetical protein